MTARRACTARHARHGGGTATKEKDLTGCVQAVTQQDFLAFIAGPYTIIHAGKGATPKKFPPIITARYGPLPVPPVRLGVVDLATVDWTFGVRLYVVTQLSLLGMKSESDGQPPSGFYLFANSVLVGFHPGTGGRKQSDEQVAFAAVANIFGQRAEDPTIAEFGKFAGMAASTWNAGEQVIEAFDKVMKKRAAL